MRAGAEETRPTAQDAPPQAERGRARRAVEGERVMIALEGIGLAFEEERILDGLDLEVLEGETMCVVGPSGCGKSTLLKVILRLLIPDSGRVRVQGRDLAELSYQEILAVRRTMGMVFQESALFDSITVYENVAYPLREHTDWPEEQIESRVARALRMVDLEMEELGERLPAELSGGQKKRVGIARAIVHEPEILLFDEPTAALDPVTSATIVQLIRRLHSELEVTSVVVTHDLRAAFKIATRIAVLRGGRIGFLGTPDEMQVSDDPYVKLFLG